MSHTLFANVPIEIYFGADSQARSTAIWAIVRCVTVMPRGHSLRSAEHVTPSLPESAGPPRRLPTRKLTLLFAISLPHTYRTPHSEPSYTYTTARHNVARRSCQQTVSKRRVDPGSLSIPFQSRFAESKVATNRVASRLDLGSMTSCASASLHGSPTRSIEPTMVPVFHSKVRRRQGRRLSSARRAEVQVAEHEKSLLCFSRRQHSSTEASAPASI